MTHDHTSLPQRRGVLFQPVGNATLFEPKRPVNSLARMLRGLFSRLRIAIAREYRIRRDLRHVAQLDKHMLKDIGLEPDQCMDALRYGRDAYWRP